VKLPALMKSLPVEMISELSFSPTVAEANARAIEELDFRRSRLRKSGVLPARRLSSRAVTESGFGSTVRSSSQFQGRLHCNGPLALPVLVKA
jgi:hypothetical protein